MNENSFHDRQRETVWDVTLEMGSIRDKKDIEYLRWALWVSEVKQYEEIMTNKLS